MIRPVAPDDIATALAATLSGGDPMAPVPESGAEPILTMLQAQRPAEVDELAVVVATSGSTGVPKGVLLTRPAVVAGVEATHDRLGGPGDWTLALPEHYVAGLMVTARTLVAGTTLHRAGPHLDDLPETAHPSRPQYLSLVPTQLVRALERPEVMARLARYDAILVGGAASSADLLERARTRGLRIVTTYGMSETCGGCVYDGQPLAGVELRVDTTAPIAIRGPMLFSGYRGRADLTAEALQDGWLVTRDRGRIVDGRLEVLGRLDDIVISGGVNVDLAEVETVVRRVAAEKHDHPVEVAVVGVPDPEWGTRVVAVSESPLTREDLSGDLSGARLPRQVETRNRLPRTRSGKIDRQRLLAELAAQPERVEDR